MSKKPTTRFEGAADAAADFADGHVDPVAPSATGTVVGRASPLAAADPLGAMRQQERVALTEDVLREGVTPSYILIVCGTPGFRRGGISHPSRAEYPLDAFTQDQLDAFISEPRLEMVTVGGEPVARFGRLFGATDAAALPRDPLLAGQAAGSAISSPPNRAAPGMRNVAAGGTRA